MLLCWRRGSREEDRGKYCRRRSREEDRGRFRSPNPSPSPLLLPFLPCSSFSPFLLVQDDLTCSPPLLLSTVTGSRCSREGGVGLFPLVPLYFFPFLFYPLCSRQKVSRRRLLGLFALICKSEVKVLKSPIIVTVCNPNLQGKQIKLCIKYALIKPPHLNLCLSPSKTVLTPPHLKVCKSK